MALVAIGYHSTTMTAAASPYAVRNVRCNVAGQVALERTAADCKHLQAATTKAATTPAVQKTLTPTPAPKATVPPPVKTAEKKPVEQPVKTATTPTPKPKQATPTITKPSTTKPNATTTYCAHFGPDGATTTNGPCGGSGSSGIPAGFHRYLCTVEHRTDNFCTGY